MKFRMFARSILSVPILAASVLVTMPICAQTPVATSVKNIVLVHGAWADGSSWSKLIPLLEAKGFHVVAVQHPLTSIAEDVAAANRIIDAQDGPVLLVGHSYGGAIITEAGNNPKVAGLVYVAAFARMKEKLWLAWQSYTGRLLPSPRSSRSMAASCC